MKLHRDVRDFIESLNSHRVEYVIVGGHAVAYHGHPRFTGDIDFFVRPSAENLSRVEDAIADFGFEDVRKTGVVAGRILQLGRVPNRIDVLTEVSGLSFEEAWASRVAAVLDGLQVRFASREALIQNKRAAGRPKDLADLAALED